MCGIAGEVVVDGSGSPDVEAVERMTAAMRSRGPDGVGHWSAGRVALGHRRLSVIDLSDNGAQPMVDDELGLAVVFNGCVYNYEDLRAELSDQYRFTSTSDTEVVLKAYDRWGERFVDHLVGMFAIALVDRRRDRVLLVRDRLGIKPLYVAEVRGRTRFASTLPALLAGGGVDTELDPVGLHHYLTWHSIVPAPRTILRGVRKLPPATVRVLEPGREPRDHVYWQPSYTRRPEHEGWTGQDWRDAVREALRTAVRRRTVSDVEVGVLLSGGLDSSLLVALLAEQGHRPSTFSIGFTDRDGVDGDEFAYSDAVVHKFGTDHHQLRIGDEEIAPAVRRAVGAMSEPMGTHDVTAFHLVCREVSRHVKVVQSGQGADEVFAGYRYHQPAAGAARHRAAAVLREAFHDHDDLAHILQPDWLAAGDPSGELLARHLDAPGADTALDAVLRTDTHLLMPDDPVKRVDNMAMAWGVEARVPFLDQDLVELVAACPPGLKADQGGKGVLKDIGRELLPVEVVDRPKGYFPVPALTRLDGAVLDLAVDALRSPAARRRGVLRPDYVDSLLAGPNDHVTKVGGNELWHVGVLEMWLQQHGIG
ncbi:N-acetylglutaminylglutamine amidotransferase [Saccharothrix longispora]|uniref:asparagine synthase (glutamine-hydrolyzing) n=1 Tax=Saccharothrix longispora TaxID=33920 RepID=A0ABU1PW35_9PSEU|nr:N-acetylglutaminylglutamine amidotransferase [Saccharothrix longispora]MDR6594855.1 asparagine synthase (glutamine-hydrolyzing) [Saccharothrix longispora]